MTLRKTELLDQAIGEAQRSGEMDIVTLLRVLQEGDFQTLEEHASQLHRALLAVGRTEEGWTVVPVGLDLRASLAERFGYFPLEQQAQAFEMGLRACQQTDTPEDGDWRKRSKRIGKLF